jgi:non-specific serine/threonine protein kinase
VPLSAVVDPNLVIPTIAGRLQVAEGPGWSPLANLIGHVVDKQLLLVLDNFEQVLGAAPELAELLGACPGVTILVTSRAILRVAGEVEFRVPPLAMPACDGDVTALDLAEYEAIRLFVERARGARPDFALSDENAAAIVETCRELDGLPLAIELAAARVRVLSIGQIADKLKEGFQLRTSQPGADLSRHNSLEAALEWSYRLLHESERVLLRRLSVFAGGWPLEAAEAVCSDDDLLAEDVLDRLSQLVEKSLVVAEERDASVRYRLLQTVRLYAEDRLRDAGETNVLRTRHLRWYTALAEHVPVEEFDPTYLVIEHENVRAALRWAIASRRVQDGYQLFHACLALWYAAGYFSEGRAWFAELAALPDAFVPTLAFARALHTVASLAHCQGQFDIAQAYVEKSRLMAERLGDEGVVAVAVHIEGNVARGLGRLALARECYESARRINQRLDRRTWQIINTQPLAMVLELQRNLSDARTAATESLTLSRARGYSWGVTRSLQRLGSLATKAGDHAAAAELLQQALAAQRAAADRQGICYTLISLAEDAEEVRELTRARAFYAECLDVARETSQRREIAQCLEGLAASIAEFDPSLALCLCAAAAAIREVLGASYWPAERERLDRWLPAVREHLGLVAYDAAEARGRAMAIDDAIRLALNWEFPAPVLDTGRTLPPALIGRARDVATLGRLVRTGSSPLVTLVGVGGCGKTSLALNVATQVRRSFADGVVFVSLAAVRDPASIGQALTLALGTGSRSHEGGVGELRSRACLLVLDNCEHLIDACADLVEQVVTECPNVRVLATSREPLRVVAEQLWPVEPLATPSDDAATTPRALLWCPSVQLFVTRAQAVAPDFRLSADNASAIADVCRRVDGIPLAIELAAARVSVLPVEQIANRLDDAMSLLRTGGGRVHPPRHHTLRTALDWSHDLLSANERMVFRRLAVFRSGCDLEQAEQVCAGEDVKPADVLDLLSGLVSKSLVVAVRTEGRAVFSMLEPVRQYAEHLLLASDDVVRTRQRHAAAYLTLAERGAAPLLGAERIALLKRLAREHDNLEAALRWAHESGEVELGLRLAGALTTFWDGYGSSSADRACLALLLEATPTTAVPAAVRTRACFAAGCLAHWEGMFEDAAARFGESLLLAREIGDTRAIPELLMWLGVTHRHTGDLDSAVRMLEESLALYAEIEDQHGHALALHNLGLTVRHTGDAARAAQLGEQASARFSEMGDALFAARARTMLAFAMLQLGAAHRAAELLTEALAQHAAMADRWFIAHGLLGLAGVFDHWQQPVRAAQLLGTSDELRARLGSPMELVAPAREAIATSIRAQLSESEFERACKTGRTLSAERAIEHALQPVGT